MIIKLATHAWRNLALVLDGIPQKDLPTTSDVRKCMGAVKQIHKAIEKPIEEYEKLNAEMDKIKKPIQDKITLMREKRGLSVDQANLDPTLLAEADKGNKLLEPTNKKFEVLDKKYSEDEVEIEFNEEYKNFIKTNWEDRIRPIFHNEVNHKMSREIMMKIADAFGI